MQKITPFLWYDTQAEEAVKFYTSIFKKSKMGAVAKYDEAGAKASGRPKGSVMTVSFTLNGQEFTALNGGPLFPFTPAVSFFVYCKTEQEINELFKHLSVGGQILMPLAKYPFSERYAFLSDKYGVSWQLMRSPKQSGIVPCLLFVGKDLGKAEAAVRFYTTVFKHASINSLSHYSKGEPGQAGTVKHSSFLLEGQEFIAMDGTGPHKFTFNESISFVVNCKDQSEIDYFWESFTKGGQEVQCGWLKDKFGISWQVVPEALGKMMSDKDPKKSQRVMEAMLKMKKLDIQKLEQAYKEA